MSATGSFLAWSVYIGFGFLILAIILAFVRLVRGPSLPDRVVALDLLIVLAVAFSVLVAIASNVAAYLDVAIALALVAFLATIAFARFAERREAKVGHSTERSENEC